MQCIGLAADGEDGVVRMLELLEQEVRICMGLLGVNTLFLNSSNQTNHHRSSLTA